MGYQALLFRPDEKTARTVTQVLSELEFAVESCIEPFAAIKKLMGQHFDAAIGIIADPSGNLQDVRFALNKPAEADALDTATN